MVRFCNKIIQYSFYLLFALVPLILTPWNYELFEFNKIILTYLLTVIIIGAWLIKMTASKKIIFQRTPLDVGVLLFLFSQIASTIFSIDRHTSLFGYYSRFNGGLFSIISYILLYYAFVSNMNKKQALFSILYSLFSATLVAIYGILEHFGIDEKYWVQAVRLRVFSTLGQPNWLAEYLVGLMPMTWALALSIETRNTKQTHVTCYLLLVTINPLSLPSLYQISFRNFGFWGSLCYLLGFTFSQAFVSTKFCFSEKLRKEIFGFYSCYFGFDFLEQVSLAGIGGNSRKTIDHSLL